MTWFYQSILRPVLFSCESEPIHNFTLRCLSSASRSAVGRGLVSMMYKGTDRPVTVFGLRFPNPIGLAAGMDKFASALPIWQSIGFGFCELGGVTWQEQPGNPQPRMFRAVADEALVNRMGFNNPGAERMAETLARWKASDVWPSHPVGINLGKSKATPLDQAAEDYANSFKVLLPYGDFFVVNVSSPNTPGLRKLQGSKQLSLILEAVNAVKQAAGSSVPVLIKVAAELPWEAYDELVNLAFQYGLAGIVATNTTTNRPAAFNSKLGKTYQEEGGLSGAPLKERSTAVIRHLHKASEGKLPIIGVGGIMSADDAQEKFDAGASLVQIYTGIVYRGPGLIRKCVNGSGPRS